jgi:CRP-like cAMP-binding protein
MFFTVKGQVGLCVLDSEKTDFVIYTTVTEGYYFGEVDMLLNDRQIHREYAKAKTRVELLALTYDELCPIIEKHPDIQEQLLLETLQRQNRHDSLKRQALE